MFDQIISKLIHLIYPRRCFACKSFTKSQDSICEDCNEKIETISVTTCPKCGLPLKNCDCYRFIYHFAGIVSPFENRDVMQTGIYNLKFSGELDAAEFYGTHMATAVQKKFEDVTFDIVCVIPMHIYDRAKRGYNQAELLAKQVAKNIGCQYDSRLLQKVSTSPAQHNLSIEKRFTNVRNLYSVRKQAAVKNKIILLVDDIKTTGATLDECARQLLLAGAERIYCATALITFSQQEN